MKKLCSIVVLVAAFGAMSAGSALAHGWSQPVAVIASNVSPQRLSGPAIDAAGDVFVAWADTSTMWLAVRRAGGTSSTIRIGSAEALGVPQIAVDAAGDVVIGWLSLTASNHVDVFDATVSASGTVAYTGSPLVDTGSTTVFATNVTVSSNASGAAAIAWVEPTAQQKVIDVRTRSSPTQGLGSQVTFGTVAPAPIGQTTDDAAAPALAVDSSGNVILAYDQGGELLEVNGPQWPTVPVALSTDTSSGAPVISASPPGGNAILGWLDTGGSNAVMDVSLAVGSGGSSVLFSHALVVSDGVNSIFAGTPSVAIDALGNAIAAWEEMTPGIPVEAVLRPAGGVFSPTETQIVSPSGDLNVDTAMTGQGGAIVTYATEPGGNTSPYQLNSRAISVAGTLSPPQTIATNIGSGTEFLAPQLDALGEELISWETHGSGGLSAAAYVAGPRVGAISAPGAGTAGTAVSMSIPAPADLWPTGGTDTVTWSFGDGGSSSGTGVSHVYNAAGQYTVTATATDALGNSASATAQINVAAAPSSGPGPSLPSSTPVCAVPNIAHVSLAAARKDLAKASCVLGKVKKQKRPRSTRGLSYGVVAQSVKANTVKPLGTKVNVTEGWYKPPKKPKHK